MDSPVVATLKDFVESARFDLEIIDTLLLGEDPLSAPEQLSLSTARGIIARGRREVEEIAASLAAT